MADVFFSDIDTFFTMNPVTGDVNRVTNEAAIEQSIRNLVTLNKFEKLMQPGVFSGVRSELFELISPISATNITQRIKDVIKNEEPRVEDVEVSVNALTDQNAYDIIITYLPKNSIEPVTIQIFLERVL